ncbi:M48 family metallopeptidase [Sphingomonas sp. Mn802worker]|uniref:M48 family metallopeptidase n=1 Tax=Sphingomonas sp. Mn802worker TaxID=629773 RepID=UPI00036B9151|nr:M48 family metallopeptidase [Sphingomonas sp. Mn802worker]
MFSRKHVNLAFSHLAAIAGLSLGASGVAAAKDLPAEQLARADARLAAIGYRLASMNGASCDAPMMITGLSLHDLASYGRRDRALVQARGLGTGFAVQAEVAGGAAARAGLAVGDEIIAINDRDVTTLGASLIRSRATYARVELFTASLDSALRAAPAVLTVRRGTTRQQIVLTADPGCGGAVTVQPGTSVNAWADGRYVAVTSRVMDLAAVDDELAFVVAHEMAHNILHHRGEGQHSALFPKAGRGVAGIKQSEIEADQLAVRLIAQAGYDTAAPERFLRRVAPSRWADLSITHPSIGRRIQLVNAVRDDLDRVRIEIALARGGYVPAPGQSFPITRVAADMVQAPASILSGPRWSTSAASVSVDDAAIRPMIPDVRLSWPFEPRRAGDAPVEQASWHVMVRPLFHRSDQAAERT